ncbi:MAG TPA: GTPase [archaeon]|nr:GTPase [archaeon]
MPDKSKKKTYWDIVNDVIKESDIVLQVLDGRLVEETRNKEIEDKIRRLRKPLIYVINKCDLIDKDEAERQKKRLRPSVFVSATKKLGTTMLLHEILRQAKDVGARTDKILVGVLGYPNTGKSSVINSLAGRSSAKSSPISGFTKAMQLIKLTKNIYLMDTPGVLPYKEANKVKHVLISATDQTKLSDPESAAMELIKFAKGKIEEVYGVEQGRPEAVLKRIAIKYNRVKKGGVPDTEVMARKIIQEWQKGRIRI